MNTRKEIGRQIVTGLLAVLMVVSLVNIPAGSATAASKKKITLNKTVATVTKGKKLKLKAKISDSKLKKKKVVWKSSKKSVATVSTKGVVTGKKAGKAKITATIKGTKNKATCTVTVVNKVSNTTENVTNNVPTEVPVDYPQVTTESNTTTESSGQNTPTDGQEQGTASGDYEDAKNQKLIELDYVMDENNPTRFAVVPGQSTYVGYTSYKLGGFRDALGIETEPQFVLADKENTEIVSIEKYSASLQEKNAPKTWTYRVKTKYKNSNAIQIIYIEYQKKSIDFFVNKIYKTASNDNTFIALKSYQDENGKECIRVFDKEKGFDSWDDMAAVTKNWYETYPKIQLKMDADKHELVMGISGTTKNEEGRFDEIGRYPIEVSYYPSITKVTDGDSYIESSDANYGFGTVGDVAYAVIGEEDTLSAQAEFETNDEGVSKIEYKPYDEIVKEDKISSQYGYCDLAGELLVTFLDDNQKEITVTYGIYYRKQIHMLQLTKIHQENNLIVKIDEVKGNYDVTCTDYYVLGTADDLISGEDCKAAYQFDVSHSVDTVSVEEEETNTSRYKNYRMTIRYRGETQCILIHYYHMTEEELLPGVKGSTDPTKYIYTDENGKKQTKCFREARFINNEGNRAVAMIMETDIDSDAIDEIEFKSKFWYRPTGVGYSFGGYLGYSITADEEGNPNLSIRVRDQYVSDNKNDKIVATFPLVVKYVPPITLVKPEDNIIVSSGVVSDSTGMEQFEICAENEEAGTDWQFEVPEGYTISYDPETQTETGNIGTITVIEEGKPERILATYPVVYKRKNHALKPEYIEAEDNIIISIYRGEGSTICSVDGSGDKLGEVVKLVCDSEIGENYEVKEVENEDWNYEIEVVYKGEKQIIKIYYQRNPYQLLPEWVQYVDDTDTNITLDNWRIYNDETISYKIAVDFKDFEYRDRLLFRNPNIFEEMKCKYSLEESDSGEYVLILSQGKQSISFPTLIEYVPRILTIKSSGNDLHVYRSGFRENETQLRQHYYRIDIDEESLSANGLNIETTDPDATACYRAFEEGEEKVIDGSTAKGEIVLSYTDEKGVAVTKTYPVVCE